MQRLSRIPTRRCALIARAAHARAIILAQDRRYSVIAPRSRSQSEHRVVKPPCSSRAYTPEYKSYTIGDMSMDEYHRVSDVTMDTLTENLEALGDEIELQGMDVEYSSGVLTLNLGEKGTFVINKQPPNKQIWLSSPLSGPKRFDYDTGSKVWFYQRDGSTLDGLLNTELMQLLDREVEVLALIE